MVRRLLPLLCLISSGCVTVAAPLLIQAPVGDEAALTRAVEDFYRASTPEAMRTAVRDAQQLAPASARTHELAAELAALEGREADSFEHLFAALLDTADDAAQLHLHLLCELEWTFEQRTRAVSLLRTLALSHPDEQVRANANWQLTYLLNNNGADSPVMGPVSTAQMRPFW